MSTFAFVYFLRTMMKYRVFFIPMALFFFLSTTSVAQFWDPNRGCIVDDATNECVNNTILTAVPFLRINPDSRTGGMGDAGLAISPDPNAMHMNVSKLAFAEKDLSIAATYTPWLRNLGIDDIYLAYLTGYKRIDDLQTIGFGLRFFSLGDIQFTDENGNQLGTGRPREFDITVGYARKLSENFSASLSGKYIYSNLAADQIIEGQEIKVANAFAVDIGVSYKTPITLGGQKQQLTIGSAMTNIGSKVSYIEGVKDFLPGNFGIGAALDLDLDEYNLLTLTLDVNKLLVPSPIRNPDIRDEDGNGIPDFREKGLFEGVFGSFGDAEGGFTEELQELMFSAGIEYWYDRQFAIRAGYFHEHALKGDRKFLTLGVGLKYNVYGMNLSYLVPTSYVRSPLANTLRFTLMFDFEAFNENSDVTN